MKDIIYLDNAATTFPKPECVYEKMDEINRSLAVNAGRGSYALAREAVKIMDTVRTELLEIANASQVAEVVITPSATVALNQIIGGMEMKESDVVYVSPFEHNAVMRTLHLKQQNTEFRIMELPLKEGEIIEIDLERMEYEFAQNPPTHVFLSHISNVTGYILPVKEIATAAKQYQAEVIVDASQSLGLVQVDFAVWNIDYLVFAGHKTLYGPFGIGGFIIRHGKELKPYLTGGTGSDSLNPNMPAEAPAKYEAASPNIVAAAGLLAALENLKQRGAGEYEVGILGYMGEEKRLTKMLVEGLQKISGVKVYLPRKERHIGIVAFTVRGYQASDVGMILDEDYGIAVRTGYHCAPLVHKVLQDEQYGGVVRVSVGRFTTKEEVQALVAAVREIVEG